jgi:hypothetical protein
MDSSVDAMEPTSLRDQTEDLYVRIRDEISDLYKQVDDLMCCLSEAAGADRAAIASSINKKPEPLDVEKLQRCKEPWYGRSQVLFLRARTAGFSDLEDLAKKLVDLTFELRTSQRQARGEETLANLEHATCSRQAGVKEQDGDAANIVNSDSETEDELDEKSSYSHINDQGQDDHVELPSVLEEEDEDIWFDKVPTLREQQNKSTDRGCACGCFQKTMMGDRSADMLRMIENAPSLHPCKHDRDRRSVPNATFASRKRVAAEDKRRTKYNSEEFEAFAKEFCRKNLKIVNTYEMHLSWSSNTSLEAKAVASCDVAGLSLCHSAGM